MILQVIFGVPIIKKINLGLGSNPTTGTCYISIVFCRHHMASLWSDATITRTFPRPSWQQTRLEGDNKERKMWHTSLPKKEEGKKQRIKNKEKTAAERERERHNIISPLPKLLAKWEEKLERKQSHQWLIVSFKASIWQTCSCVALLVALCVCVTFSMLSLSVAIFSSAYSDTQCCEKCEGCPMLHKSLCR